MIPVKEDAAAADDRVVKQVDTRCIAFDIKGGFSRRAHLDVIALYDQIKHTVTEDHSRTAVYIQLTSIRVAKGSGCASLHFEVIVQQHPGFIGSSQKHLAVRRDELIVVHHIPGKRFISRHFANLKVALLPANLDSGEESLHRTYDHPRLSLIPRCALILIEKPRIA